MNPVVLLALGGVALMVASRKKGNGAAGNGNGTTNGDGTTNGGNGNGTTNGGGNGNGTTNGGEPGGIYVPPVDVPFPMSQPGLATPGTFYQVTSADLESGRHPIEDIAAMAIRGIPHYTGPHVHAYALCITASPWNLYYYGVEDAYSQLAVDDMTVDGALQTVNYDALSALKNGVWPETAIVTTPSFGMGASPAQRDFLGLLWLPPARLQVNPNQTGSYLPLACPEGDWGGGISQLFPPPAILNSLGGPRPPWWAAPDPGGQQA